jgi:hypothetical protein
MVQGETATRTQTVLNRTLVYQKDNAMEKASPKRETNFLIYNTDPR